MIKGCGYMEKHNKEILLEEIMIAYGNELVRLAFAYVKDSEVAKDMVQNTFIKCFDSLDNFRYESTIKTWLYRITINECKDYLKSWNYRMVQVKTIIHDTAVSLLPSAEDNVMENSQSETIKDIIFSLPKIYREVIYLYYYKSFMIDEIAELTDLNAATVKTRLRRGRQKLKLMMEEANIHA
jgi:RNA polymerase sigma factor (sigma-70 family)